MKEYDVVIVGAGPAGLGAAAECGKQNLHTLLVERNKLGKSYKVWGEFPDRIAQVGLEDSILNDTSYFQQGTYFGTHQKTPIKMVFLDETKALEILASKVPRDNVEVRENTNCYAYHRDEQGRLRLNLGGDEVRARFMIDGSGYKSNGELDDSSGLVFEQNKFKTDCMLQLWAYVCENTNVDQDVAIMCDVPFATKNKALFYAEPLGKQDALIGVMYTLYDSISYETAKKDVEDYLKCKRIKGTPKRVVKGFIPANQLFTGRSFDQELLVGDAIGAATSGTYYGLIESIKTGERAAKCVAKKLKGEQVSYSPFVENNQFLLNSYLGILTEKVVYHADDPECDNLLKSMIGCPAATLERRIRNELTKEDIKLLIGNMRKHVSIGKVLRSLPWSEFSLRGNSFLKRAIQLGWHLAL